MDETSNEVVIALAMLFHHERFICRLLFHVYRFTPLLSHHHRGATHLLNQISHI